MRDANKVLKERGAGKPTSVFMASNHQANGHSRVSIPVPAQALPVMPDAGMTCAEYIMNQKLAGYLGDGGKASLLKKSTLNAYNLIEPRFRETPKKYES
ncbi:hypothetical protein AVEN_100803-1 [Araneus ventricosus]|uniref:Uncharacterized protein n=1 Tax=Araneus ventricosus TaxID=182803 RepID=A0A4Y2AXB8_ARAVE|nr:hypothetical protein AVEN_100803-1 [Araneus ventricosus]